MKHWAFSLIVLISTVLFVTYSSADEIAPICGYDSMSEELRSVFPHSGNYTVKAIYISFNDCGEHDYQSCAQQLPTYHDILFSSMVDFIDTESHGDLQLTYQTIADPRNPGQCWIAEYPLRHYVNLPEISEYGEFTEEIWAEVHAEIYFKIKEVYEEYNLDDPFEDCRGLFFVQRHRVWTQQGVAGYGKTGLIGLEDHATTGMSMSINTRLYGSGVFNLDSLKFIALHEFGHTLGLSHAPDDPVMVLGPYAVMRASVLMYHGFVPFNYKELHSLGWIPEPNVVEEEEEGIQLSDLQSPSGSYLKIRLDSFGGLIPHEYFNLSYHGGMRNAQTVYLSEGVSVWHTIEQEYDFVPNGWRAEIWDFEQAEGRYDGWSYDPQHGPPSGTPNPVNGRDRMDIREGTPEDFISRYRGAPGDFFPVVSGSISEFSYRTNPSTYGNSGLQRISPQDFPLSLAVLMTKGIGNNVVVDVLNAPREKILTPQGDIALTADGPNSSIDIGIDSYFYWEDCPPGLDDCNIITTVEVWYSPHGGDDHTYYLVRELDYENLVTNNGGVFTISSSELEPSASGRLRLVYRNTLGTKGTFDYQGIIGVEGVPIVRELVILPNGREKIPAGVEYEIRWTSSWGSDILRVDLFVSYDSGMTYPEAGYGIAVSSGDGYNSTIWVPEIVETVESARVKLGFHSLDSNNNPVYTESFSFEDFMIYRRDAIYDEVTSTGFLNYSEYDPPFLGEPSAVVHIRVGSNEEDAVLVGIKEGTGGIEGKLFLNNSDETVIYFEDRTYEYLPLQLLDVGLGPLVVADFDLDGRDDFFACSFGSHPSRMFRQGVPSFEDVSNSVFVDIPPGQISNVVGASWVDIEKNGTNYLYLNRRSSFGGASGLSVILAYDSTDLDFYIFESRETLLLRSVAGASVATWADYSRSGLWCVAVGNDDGVVVYRPGSTGDYYPVYLPVSLPAQRALSAQWVDLNRDGLLDLLVLYAHGVGGANSPPAAYAIYNNGGEDISTWQWEMLPTGGGSVVCAYPIDYNLDGWVDVLFYSDDGSDILLLQNFRWLDGWAAGWHDVSDAVGLTEGAALSQEIGSLLAADLDGDGDLDLFFGRSNAIEGTLFRNEQPDGVNSPMSNWIGVEFVMLGAAPPFGATVNISGGGVPLGSQVFDGGGGVNQRTRALIFGLGDYNGPIDITITWPDGEFTVGAGVLNRIYEIVASASFSISTGSFDRFVEFNPIEQTYDWVFTWETDYVTDPSRDLVEITLQSGADCEIAPSETLLLQDVGSGDVISTVVYDPSNDHYIHELRWVARSCFPSCTYVVEKVESAFGVTSVDFSPSGKPRVISFTHCIGQY